MNEIKAAYDKERDRIEEALKAIGYQLRDINIEWYTKGIDCLDKLPGLVIHVMPIIE